MLADLETRIAAGATTARRETWEVGSFVQTDMAERIARLKQGVMEFARQGSVGRHAHARQDASASTQDVLAQLKPLVASLLHDTERLTEKQVHQGRRIEKIEEQMIGGWPSDSDSD